MNNEKKENSKSSPAMQRKGNPSAFIVEKPKDFKGSFKKIITYMGKYKISMIFVIIIALASIIFSIAGPKILGMATTEIFTGLMAKLNGTGVINFNRIGIILLIALALYLFSSAFSFIQGWIMAGITQKLCFRMRREISEKINHVPIKYFESKAVGEVLSRITNDVDTIGQGLGQSITQIITSLVSVVGIITIMFTISPLMTVIALVVVPISAALMGLIVKFSQKHFKSHQQTLGNINGQIEEIFGGQDVVRAFNREEACIEEFSQINQRLYNSAWKAQFFSGLMQPVMLFVGNLGYVGVVISGSLLAIKHIISIGDIQAFIQYVKNLTQPIATLAQISGVIQSMTAAAERVFEFLAEEEEIPETSNPESTDNINGNVSFNHVSFGYNPEHPVIKDFNASVKAGQTVALVGPTGAGKTTVVKLLMRFYDVDSGAILIDGKDIRNFKRSDLRKMFGMVLQDTWLFKGNIMENIRYGRLDANDDEVISAAKAEIGRAHV